MAPTTARAKGRRFLGRNAILAMDHPRRTKKEEGVTVDAEKRITKMKPGQGIGGPGRAFSFFDWRSKERQVQ
jgi:hypothetical protein